MTCRNVFKFAISMSFARSLSRVNNDSERSERVRSESQHDSQHLLFNERGYALF